ncbi:MAG: transposase [bacterium]|nr:transposase [bacterium]
MEDGLIVYRRNLPHWRLSGSYYFVTWRLDPEQSDLSEDERDVVAAAIKFFSDQRYRLCAYVVMDDHCHTVLQPLDGHSLQSIMYTWKSFTTSQLHRLGLRAGQLWQREYFDRIIRNEDEFWEKVTYIINNPRKRMPEVDKYVWAEWFAFE